MQTTTDHRTPVSRRRLVLGLALSAAAALSSVGGCPNPAASSAALAVQAEDHVLASGTPLVTVIEYANAECPHCAEFERDAFPTIRAQYVDTGKVRWVYRYLASTPAAIRAAQASECAAQQDSFWEYLALLATHPDALSDVELRDDAQTAGLDLAMFDACLATGDTAHVGDDLLSAVALGVNITPTFFIGQQRVVEFPGLGAFTALLDEALAAAPAGSL